MVGNQLAAERKSSTDADENQGGPYLEDFVNSIEKFRKAVPKSQSGAVIYAGDLTPTFTGVKFINFSNTIKLISK